MAVLDLFGFFSDSDLQEIAALVVTDFKAARGRVLKMATAGDVSSETEQSISQSDFLESLNYEMRARGLIIGRARITRTRARFR